MPLATALNLTRAAKRLFPSAGSPFPSCPLLSRDPGVFCLGTTADIRTDPFQYSITSIDRHTGCRIWQVVFKTCGNLCFILHIGSRGCQRHGWTLHPHVSTCFKQEVCYVDGDRDTPQNHGSWVSREFWRREPEMRNPGKSHADWSWKNLKIQILSHQNMPHWTATICWYCRWKTVFKTVATSAEAPGRRCSWRPQRPSPPAAAWRSPRSRCMLHYAAESNLSTAGVGAPPAAAPRGFWAPGPALSRTSTAAPFARRKATIAVWSQSAAWCSAASRRRNPTSSKSRSRQRRSRRRWPRTAARLPKAAARAMLSSRRAEKCSKNEVPQFLRSSCSIFSTSPSLLLMEIILNKLETELIELL